MDLLHKVSKCIKKMILIITAKKNGTYSRLRKRKFTSRITREYYSINSILINFNHFSLI